MVGDAHRVECPALKDVVGGAVEHGTKAMLLPAATEATEATDAARQVYEATGGDAAAAIKAFGLSACVVTGVQGAHHMHNTMVENTVPGRPRRVPAAGKAPLPMRTRDCCPAPVPPNDSR